MQRRSFLKRLAAGAVSLLGLGTVKAAQPVPVKEPLRIVECLAGYERWQYSEDGHAERISGGYSRLNRMPEPGEALPFNLHFPSGYRLVEHKLDMPLFEPVVYWRTHIREITKADKRSLLNGLKSYYPMDGRSARHFVNGEEVV